MVTDLAIDGMAARFGGEYVIVLNPSIAHDRGRMNAAHELGHVLLGDCDKECGHGDTASERRAYEFASYLLIPDRELRAAFDGRSMIRLVKAKEHFGISLQAMIYRAEQEGIIPKSVAKWLWVEFAKRGWRKKEPGKVLPDRATRFEDILDSAVGKGLLTWEDAAKVMRVPLDELHLRMRFALGRGEDTPLEGGDDAEDGPAILSFPAR
jgi:Zn-dependent peptidase ImmA (M78 family)